MCLYLKYGIELLCKYLKKKLIYMFSGYDMYYIYFNLSILIYEFKDKIGFCIMYWLGMDELIIYDKNII